MYWFLDNAIYWYILLGIVGLIIGAVWWGNRQPKILIGVAVVVGAMALIWLLTRLIVTDYRQIDSILHEMADAAVDGKPTVFLNHLAKDFDYEGKKGPIVAEKTADAAKRYKIYDIAITGLDLEEVKQDTAKVFFRATLRTRLDERPQVIECHAVFVGEGDHWKLKGIRFNFPLSNQPVVLPID